MSRAARIAGVVGLVLLWRSVALAQPCVRTPGAPVSRDELRPVGLGPGDRFGAAVAIREDLRLIAVGAYLSDAGGRDSGAVYLFKREADGWVQIQRLQGTAGEQLGFDLAIDSGQLVVGAPAVDDDSRPGAAYRYALDAEGCATGREPLSAAGVRPGDELGSAVAVRGGVIAVGARGDDEAGPDAGAVYVFETGAPRKLLPPARSTGAELGQAVALETDTLVAGAPFTGFGGRGRPGAVYVFQRSGASWGDPVPLGLPQEARADDAFGYSVAVHGNRIVVGSPLEGGSDGGAAYLYERQDGTWGGPNLRGWGSAGDQFGVSVTLDDRRILVGARRADRQARDGGAVRLLEEGCNGSVPDPMSPAPEAAAEFGFSVATRGGLHVVGAFLQDRAAADSGAAYVFERQTVQLAKKPDSVLESEKSLSLTVFREGSAAREAVTVRLQASGGTANEGEDYLLPPSVTIPRGEYSGAFNVQIRDDPVVEETETFVVELLEPQGAVLGCRFLHTVEIVDNAIVLSPLQDLVTGEDGATAQFTVQLASQPTDDVTVAFTAEPDEGTFSPSEVELTSANWDQPQTVTVTGKDDVLFDGDTPYMITGTVTATEDPAYQGRSATLTAVNRDDDRTRISGTKEVCVSAGDGTVIYTVELTNAGTVPQRDQEGDEFSDSLPGGSLSLLMAVADSGAATVDFGSNTASWNGRIPAPGGLVTITLIAALQPGVVPGDVVSNQGAIFYDRDHRDGKESAVPTDDPASPGAQDLTVFTVGAAPACAAAVASLSNRLGLEGG